MEGEKQPTIVDMLFRFLANQKRFKRTLVGGGGEKERRQKNVVEWKARKFIAAK